MTATNSKLINLGELEETARILDNKIDTTAVTINQKIDDTKKTLDSSIASTKSGLQNQINTTNNNLKNTNNTLSAVKTKVDSTKDYIVAEGTTKEWHWIKYNSGIAECWGLYSGAHQPHYAIYSNVMAKWAADDFRTSGRSFALPFTFKSAPTVHCVPLNTDVPMWYSLEKVTTTMFDGNVVAPLDYTKDITVQFHLHVIGYWK